MSFASTVSDSLRKRFGIAAKPLARYESKENLVLCISECNEYIQIMTYGRGSRYYLSWAMRRKKAQPYISKIANVEIDIDRDAGHPELEPFMMVSDDKENPHIAIPVDQFKELITTRAEWRAFLNNAERLWHLVINEAKSKKIISAKWIIDSMRWLLDLDAIQVEEGQQRERKVLYRDRNLEIVQQKKQQDNYTCEACGFRLLVNGRYIIDCHHRNPLSSYSTETVVTNKKDLLCLCPTCHRIAHAFQPAFGAEKIKEILQRRKT